MKKCNQTLGLPLPKDRVDSLPRSIRMTLRHPCRRAILRELQADGSRLSPSDLAKSGKVACSVPCVSYHMRTLRDSGYVREESSEMVRGAIKHYFTSAMEGNGVVLAVLRDTERADRRIQARA